MKLSKKFSPLWCILLGLFFACSYELVDAPTLKFNEKKNASDYKDFILPPSNITASHGYSKKVVLKWEKVPNAVQYQIYSAATPFDVFTEISETKGDETEISIDESEGISKYYCVCAVNYYGTVSSKSIVTYGSTLSVPVITQVSASEEGSSIIVDWWMDNCNESTYQDDVKYIITVYENASTNVALKTLTIDDGAQRSALVEGLQSTTEYFFTIEARTKNGDKETSNRTSAQTAHRVVPEPVANLKITQGDSKDKITLSWELPVKVWYRTNSGSSGFELHPLYFEIYRREAGSAGAFEKINTYTITSYPEDTETDAANRTCTYDDTTGVVRGKQYEYYVQSFTAELPAGKTVTSDSSKTEITKGWRLSVPKLSITSEHQIDNNNKFTTIVFNPHFSFETFGVSYNYKLEITGEALPGESNTPASSSNEFALLSDFEKYCNGANLINPEPENILVFTDPVNQKGYYSFKVSVYLGDTSIEAVSASGKYLVTDDADAVPVINNFAVVDGYKDKFVLTWDYNSNYTYTVRWTELETGESKSYEVTSTDSNVVLNNGELTFNHSAAPGVQRNYELEASKQGLSTLAEKQDENNQVIVYKTLGRPDPEIAEYDYDKIFVKWNSVQMASKSYAISAKYEGEQKELSNTSNTVITEENGVFKCVITNPLDFDNASKSGKNIKLEVKATSSTQSGEETSKTIDVCTVGPANTNTVVAQNPDHEFIAATWNEVTGAKGYIIRRICGKNTFAGGTANSSDVDVYYYDGTDLFAGSVKVNEKRAKVTKKGSEYTLTDRSCEADDSTSSYEVNQSCISWGIPYSYVVIPVKQNGNADDFTCDESSVSINGATPYTNLSVKEGATWGYGLNVKAQKSDSSTEQIIEWKKPYITTNNNPSFFYREAGSSSNTWKKINTYTLNGAEKVTFKPESTTGAYEYLVAYKRSSASAVPASLINDTKLGLSTEETRYNYSSSVNKENANKGYLLAVELSADTDSDKSEKVWWNNWDYENRSIGPDSAELRIKNYNISDSWVKVASLDKDLYYSSKSEPDNTTVTQIDDVTVNLKPTKIMDQDSSLKVTPGYMQVLRDAKHYYSLALTKGETTCYVATDDTVYAYREVGDKEYAKMVMIVMNEALKSIGKLDEETEEAEDSFGGNAIFKHKSTMNMGKTYSYSFSNYAPEILMPSGKSARTLKIKSCSSECTRDQLGVGGYPKSFSSVTIKLERLETKMPATYTKDITFTLSNESSAEISVGSTKINMTTKEERRKFVPFCLHSDQSFYDTNSSYGWWTE